MIRTELGSAMVVRSWSRGLDRGTAIAAGQDRQLRQEALEETLLAICHWGKFGYNRFEIFGPCRGRNGTEYISNGPGHRELARPVLGYENAKETYLPDRLGP